MDIEKSPQVIQKENQIAALEAKIKRTRTSIKSLKTRLANTQSRIEEIQKTVLNKLSALKDRFQDLNKKLGALQQKLSKDKRLTHKDKALIGEVYRGLVGGMEENMPELSMPQFEPDEEAKAQFRDAFKVFKVAPKAEEKRDIRKLYLHLSKNFHPDLARNEKEKIQYHQIQQQINDAYQTDDIQWLIDLEQSLKVPQQPLPSLPLLDALDIQISRLENQLDLLQQQKKRLSGEIKQLRNSELGEMLTHTDSLGREGYSLEDSTGIQPLVEIIDLLEQLKQAMEDTDRKGRLSPLFDQLMMGMMGIVSMMGPSGALEDILSEMDEMGYYEDDEDFFSWDDEFIPNPSPRFPSGTAVRIVANEMLYYFDEYDREHSFSIKGYTGVVTEALLDEDGDPHYNIGLHIASMKRLPGEYIRLQGGAFFQVELLEQKALIKEKSKQTEPFRKVQQTIRELLYQYLFENTPKAQAKRLRRILLAFPAENDEFNWLACFEQQLPLPFKAQIRSAFPPLKAKQKVKITDYAGFTPEDGIWVSVKANYQAIMLPLANLEGIDKGAIKEILDDYLEWYELMM